MNNYFGVYIVRNRFHRLVLKYSCIYEKQQGVRIVNQI